jgi:malonyl-CoA decarboxylase
VACFYSISLGQPGLAGIDLGRFLIKRVAQLLLSELPHLSTLVTLSPIPGFRPWLITKLQQQQQQGSNELSLLRPEEEAGILAAAEWLASNSNSRQSSSSSGASSATAALMQLVTTNAWRQLPERQQQEVLRPLLLRLCARYLLRERRRRYAADPVANFHLRNGAQLWRLNWRCGGALSLAGGRQAVDGAAGLLTRTRRCPCADHHPPQG